MLKLLMLASSSKALLMRVVITVSSISVPTVVLGGVAMGASGARLQAASSNSRAAVGSRWRAAREV